jgi:C1A family cysteine protease/PKD repeat protein
MLTKQAELAAISAIQSAIDREGLDWVAGETSMSRLSAEEKARLGVARVGPPIKGVQIESRPLHLQGVADPPIFDWRDVDGHNWMTTVRYQGSCGSCWAFSASGAVEASFNVYSGNPNLNIDISEEFLVSACSRAGDCDGGWPDHALDHCKDWGVPDEACFPYTADDGPCTPCADHRDRRFKITGYKYINSNTTDFKWALQEYGPMCVVLTIPDDWYYYTAGVYSPTSEGVGWANHAVVLVGWDDTRGAWIIKNSYGEGWGGTGKGYGLVDFGVLEGYNYAYAVTGIEYDDVVLTCDGGSPTFGTGCDLLLAYDSDADGSISSGEMKDAMDGFGTGDITEDEAYFVIESYYDDSINATCPGCYSADVITCTGRTEHFPSGCDLLLAYDTDNVPGIITWPEFMDAMDDERSGVINAYEAAFVESAYDAGSINNLCPGCYSEDENIAPTAIASATPTFGTPPLSVQFTGQGTDPDGSIQSYNWNFGDGNVTNVQNPQHTYSDPNTYTPVLTVTDNDGATGTDNLTISVHEDGDVGVGGWISPSAVIDVSSQFGEHKPSNAIDNDRGTKWLSSPGGLQSITFDLGDQVVIDSIRAIDYYENIPNIYISNDAINWTLVGSMQMKRYVYGVAEFTAVSARYIKLERPSGTGYFSCTEMQVFAPTGTGWFKPKFAVSSSDYDSDHLAENTINGFFDDGFDCWFSRNEVPCWIRFDLGLEKTFDAVRVVSGTASLPMTLVVEVSDNDATWTPVTSNVVINESYTEIEVAITQSTARYVRLNIVDANGIGGCCEFDVHVVDDTVANIEVVSFTVTPQTCQSPCDTVVMITWKNVGTAPVTFTPGYTIDGVLYSSSPITLIPIQQGLLRETIHGLTVGSYEICPVPN